jgi:carbon-monoxide dehydrogenase small subunit
MLDTEQPDQTVRVAFTVNGEPVSVDVQPRETLAGVLRGRLGLTGTKIGCDAQVCGACTVLVDGGPVSSCTIFAFDAEGKAVLTIEGVAKDGELHPVQEGFIEFGGFQCGYCTPGMIMASVGLLEREPDPTREQVVEWLEGNICRCTGYDGIVSAVLQAAKQRRGGPPQEAATPTGPNEAAGEVADAQADAYWDS